MPVTPYVQINPRRAGKSHSSPVKTYVFARLYGASKRTARRAVEGLGLGRRQTGRAIRKAERQFARLYAAGLGYRSYDEQKRLYEKWKSRGRGVVAVPQTDPQGGSHHSRGLAIDIDMAALKSESKHRFDATLMAYTLPVQQPCSIVQIGSGA